MSTARRLDEWANAKASLPNGVNQFALVYMQDGEAVYGARYPLRRDEALAMSAKLRMMADHCDRNAEAAPNV